MGTLADFNLIVVGGTAGVFKEIKQLRGTCGIQQEFRIEYSAQSVGAHGHWFELHSISWITAILVNTYLGIISFTYLYMQNIHNKLIWQIRRFKNNLFFFVRGGVGQRGEEKGF